MCKRLFIGASLLILGNGLRAMDVDDWELVEGPKVVREGCDAKADAEPLSAREGTVGTSNPLPQHEQMQAARSASPVTIPTEVQRRQILANVAGVQRGRSVRDHMSRDHVPPHLETPMQRLDGATQGRSAHAKVFSSLDEEMSEMTLIDFFKLFGSPLAEFGQAVVQMFSSTDVDDDGHSSE